MRTVWVIVDSGASSIAGILAGEALRSIAMDWDIQVEVKSEQGFVGAIDASQANLDDVVLLVGKGEADDHRFPPKLTRVRVTLEDLLTDPRGVVGRFAAVLPGSETVKIVAVTSCPTGIAHTFMAAEGLQQAAKAMGFAIRVETQGSVGAGDVLTPDEIAAADIVLIAADRDVDRRRFAGKRVFMSGAKAAIIGGQDLIAKAFTEAQLQDGKIDDPSSANSGHAGPYKHLMTGVSFMLPFVVAGGLLIAMAFALGGIYANKQEGTLAFALFTIGAKGGFGLIIPAFAGYIAYSIADRPGIAPGMIGGVLAASLGAGFLGGIAAGFIAGYGVDFLSRKIRLPKNLEGLKPVLILPVLGTLLTGLLMIYAVGEPVAAALVFLTDWLRSMQGSTAVLLGLLLGAMMAFDMGGPVNKAACAFATGLIASQVYTPMAAAMVAGMTPPLAAALATRFFPARFTTDERQAGGAAFVLGLAFVTEGAIPFAARDPVRVIPALMVGSAMAGAISMAVGAELKVPHGGVFVLPIPGAVSHLLGYLAALVVGSVSSALLLGVLKRSVIVGDTAAGK